MRTVIEAKEQVPDAATVMGGCHITALPLETMSACPSIDYGVIGEGETTLLELVKAIESGYGIERADGVAHRRRGLGEAAMREDMC